MALNFENQKTEAKIGVRVLNRMIGLGRPGLERTALIPSPVGRVPSSRSSVQHRRLSNWVEVEAARSVDLPIDGVVSLKVAVIPVVAYYSTADRLG